MKEVLKRGFAFAAISVLPMTALAAKHNFNRIASFPVCSQLEASCNTDDPTSAEIVASSADGQSLIYTDSPMNALGFVDLTDPSSPKASGTLELSGEPTSVSVKGKYALVGVNTSADFVNVSGELLVVDYQHKKIVHRLPLGGQPDSVAISPSGKYAVVVIENERDEDLGEGVPPQAPAGELAIINIRKADPKKWSVRKVDLKGIADLYPEDPEPEFVDINHRDVAVVTMQENNHIVLVDLKKGKISEHFSAGTVDLFEVDATEEKPAIVSQTESLEGVPREPDGVAWINNHYFATADEGDLNGGSRSFTIFDTRGRVAYSSGNDLDHMAARLGHYPDARSGNKGNEPENVEVGKFGRDTFLFVNSERSSLVFVYNVNNPRKPRLQQVLPAGAAPEGGLAIAQRNLLIVASEEDSREDKIRSVLNIYQRQKAKANYPTLYSLNRRDGTPIPWSAMSGLTADPVFAGIIYAAEDSYYASNRIFAINALAKPAVLFSETTIKDRKGVLAAMPVSGAEQDPSSFDATDLAAMVNADKSVNLDIEGLTRVKDGFWIASEGAGTMNEVGDRPIEKLNMLIKIDFFGTIEQVVTLPESVNALQVRYGFEGVAEYKGKLYVAFQRAWIGEDDPRIGIYDIATGQWSFVYYRLDVRESQNAGWVGLSEITSLGNGEFMLVERDNQGGPDAAIKRLYKIDLNNRAEGSVIRKTLVKDLMGDLAKKGGLVPEKIEGAALLPFGDVFIINDNDGVDDNSGETQLINLGPLF